MVGGAVWASNGFRGSKNVQAWKNVGKEIEETPVWQSKIKPFNKADNLGLPFETSGALTLHVATPIAFVVINLVLLIVSFLR